MVMLHSCRSARFYVVSDITILAREGMNSFFSQVAVFSVFDGDQIFILIFLM